MIWPILLRFDVEKSDWKRVEGRRFQNTKTGEVISRRQYDKKFGDLQAFRSYEAKAKYNRRTEGVTQNLKPAHGRLKYRGPSDITSRLTEGVIREQYKKELREEKKRSKIIDARRNKVYKIPKKIDKKQFLRGSRMQHIETNLDYESISNVINLGRPNKKIFGWMIQLNGVQRATEENFGQQKISWYVTSIGKRDMKYPFSQADWEDILDEIAEKHLRYQSDLYVYSATVTFIYRSEYVAERKALEIKARLKRMG